MFREPPEAAAGRGSARRRLVISAGVALAVGISVASAGGARASDTAWIFTADPGVRIPSGVSPEVIQLADGTMLAYVQSTSGKLVYRSTDGLTFTQVQAQLPSGSDAAIVPIAGDRLRMYYVSSSPGSSRAEIDSATSSDGLHWTAEPGTRMMIGERPATGVPDAVVLPDGRVRLYYVMPPPGGETIDSATSNDGLNFTADPGHRFTGGYVDPAVLRLPDGKWLAIVARTPFVQPALYTARSPDGLSWTLDKPFATSPDSSGLADPTPILLPDGKVRIYYFTTGPGSRDQCPCKIVSGVLSSAPVFRLSVAVKGKGNVAGGAIACPGLCTASLADGTQLKLTASPAKGYRFASWTGVCTGTKHTCSLTLRRDGAVQAIFSAKR